MAFAGPAPELINGRLAMLGFVAALGAELSSGETVAQQFSSGGAGIIIGWAAMLFIAGSLAPILKGVKNNEAFGPLSPAAEMFNGEGDWLHALAAA
jgi:hypothetical protein